MVRQVPSTAKWLGWWSCLGLAPKQAHAEPAQGVASVVAAHAAKDIPHLLPLTLSTEVGVFGGTPAGGLRFGAAVNATTAVPCSTIIDFYQGGGIDMACLGMAEVSAAFCGCVGGYHAGHELLVLAIRLHLPCLGHPAL